MRYAADLHLHTRHADAVAADMTLETIAASACACGLDVLGTGDCLQPDHLAELEAKLEPAEPGWWRLRPAVEAAVYERVPPALRRPLRFVLSTEVSCAPTDAPRRGVHVLVYFPDFAVVREVAATLADCGDLRAGRPTLRLAPRELLARLTATPGCAVAPAHVLNPYFSALGSQEEHATLAAAFGAGTPSLVAVETGLTATPPMCRRISSLDGHGLFACSDAHSRENLGREYTVLETEPGFAPLFAALRQGTRAGGVKALVKVPLESTRYYLNHCARCPTSYAALRCPRCRVPLPLGARGRLELIADRATPALPVDVPPFIERLPLRDLLSLHCAADRKSGGVTALYDRLLAGLGDERFILGQAEAATLARSATPALARAILAQRRPGGVDWAGVFPPGEAALARSFAGGPDHPGEAGQLGWTF